MLFYNQIKRQFTHASWRRGQIYFREERVSEVKLDGDLVTGKVQGTEPSAYETAIVLARGTIFNSKCSCPAHRVYETHCKHVAALAIWVVERGSLLRAGVSSGDYGLAPGENELRLTDSAKAAADVRLRKLLLLNPFIAHSRFIIRRDLMAGSIQGKDTTGHAFTVPITLIEAAALLEHSNQLGEDLVKDEAVPAEPILFVKGIFGGKALSGLSVESAIRYRDPLSGTVQVNTLSYLNRQQEPGLWKTSQGVLLRVPAPNEVADDDAAFILRLEVQKLLYQGQAALENLARLLTHKHRALMAFDPAVDVPVETVPLKLVSFSIGKNLDQGRSVTYQFKGGTAELSSEELDELAKYGRLSSEFVWKGDRIYRFETPLSRLQQFTNRSGVAASEGDEGKTGPLRVSGVNRLYDGSDSPLHPLAAYRLSLEMGVENFNVDPDWKEFHDWRKIFERPKVPTLPKTDYGFDLREYQKNGLSWLWSLYHRALAALLADEMGLGKTHQALAFLTTLYRRRQKPSHPSLVVAPTSVIAAWVQKLKKYDTGLRWHVFHGSGRVLPDDNVDLVLTTYGILQREAVLRQREWHVVVLDEAQVIKNAATISARASRTLKSRFRIAMTGTPVENQSTDLWSLLEFLLPGYLGSLPRFKRLYGSGRDVPPEVQTAALKRLVSPFLLRRTKAQVLKELPEKTEEVVHCEMTAVQRRAYRAYLNSAEADRLRSNLEGGGKIDYANVLALLTRLKQICDHPKLPRLAAANEAKKKLVMVCEDSGKWEALDELVSEALGSGLKIVIFTQYLGMMDLVGKYLRDQKKVAYTELRGDTADRSERLDRFARDPECKVFICSLLAGGLGIDLTSASVCIHLDRWWNPAKENQATDRLHRIGQTRGVQVFKLQIPGTVEDRIASIIESKMALSGALIEESSMGLKAFSRKELLDILSPDSALESDALEPDDAELADGSDDVEYVDHSGRSH